MDKVNIRGTELVVHPIGLGTNAVGGQRLYPNITDEMGRDILLTALETGVDFWDTAYIYGPKRSEEIIGEVLSETNARKQIILASKAAHYPIGDQMAITNEPKFLEQAVYDSLKRLKTDYIDLFYIHFPDQETPKYEAVGALQKLKEKGIIRAIGVSNFSIEQVKEANQDGYVNVIQGEYNLLARDAERDYFSYVVEQGISYIPYFPFASGLLAGAYNKNTVFTKGDMRRKDKNFSGETFIENLSKVEKLKEIAKDQSITTPQLVLAWYLAQTAIDVVIPGAKKAEQINSNQYAQEITLSKVDIEKIDNIFQSSL